MIEEKRVFEGIKDIIIGVAVNLLVAGILGFVSFIWNNFELNYLWLSIIFAVVILVELVLVVIYILWRNRSYKSYQYSPSKIQYKYTVEKNVINYKVKRKVRQGGKEFYDLELGRETTVCSNAESLDRVNEKFIWTGKSEAELPMGELNVRAIQKAEDKPGVWKYYDVIFNRRIQKGDKLTLKYQWPTIHNCKSSSPFISTTTDVPTKQIEFNIDLGSDYGGKTIYMEERRSIDGDNMLNRSEYQLNENGRVKIEISPKRFRYFIVFWEWRIKK